jgi:hypothetical protein
MHELLRIPFRFRVRFAPPGKWKSFSIVTTRTFPIIHGTVTGTTNSKARPKTLIPSRKKRSPESGLRHKLRHIPETLAGGHCGFPRGEPSPLLESGCSYTSREIFIWNRHSPTGPDGLIRWIRVERGGLPNFSPQSTA